MTDSTFGRSATLPRFAIRETRDRTWLSSLLSEDRALNAYALGHLELGLFERARFWVAEGAHGYGVTVHTSGGLGRATFLAGDPSAIDALISLHPGPYQSYLATAAPEHLPVLERHYLVEGALQMQRMSVSSSTFVPAVRGLRPEGAEGPPATEHELRPLVPGDVRALNALYSTEGSPTGYVAEQIAQGIYFGAYARGMLVAAAGTHLVSPNVGIAVVGNVFTHPAFRGEGLAGRVTSAVTEELLERRGCASIALTVNPANEPAVRAYSRLGYQPGSPVVEARLRRRDVFGIGSALRRWVARRAAHGGELGDEYAPGHLPGGEGGSD